MKKITIAIISIVATILLIILFTSSGEWAGVPKQQLEEDLEEYDFGIPVNPSFTHDVDTSLHTDDVTVEFDLEFKYGVEHKTALFEYFYNRDLDIWELQNRDVTKTEYELDSRIESARFSGVTADWNPLQYDITVVDVDYENCGVTISYELETAYKSVSGTTTLGYGDQYSYSYTVDIGGIRGTRLAFTLDGIKVYSS